MKFATSYYYQIRNFKTYMIPISTAIWPPKWFVKNGRNTGWLDNNGIINGLECAELAPGPLCSGLCDGKCKDPSPLTCQFLKTYRLQLENNFNLKEFLKKCKKIEDKFVWEQEPIFVLMVYETPDNPCSERAAIQDYFTSHGIECKELNYE